MKKLMALILFGAAMVVPSAYGFFGRVAAIPVIPVQLPIRVVVLWMNAVVNLSGPCFARAILFRVKKNLKIFTFPLF